MRLKTFGFFLNWYPNGSEYWLSKLFQFSCTGVYQKRNFKNRTSDPPSAGTYDNFLVCSITMMTNYKNGTCVHQ